MPKKNMFYVNCPFRHKQSIGSETHALIFQVFVWSFTKQISVTFLHDKTQPIINHLKCDLGPYFHLNVVSRVL